MLHFDDCQLCWTAAGFQDEIFFFQRSPSTTYTILYILGHPPTYERHDQKTPIAASKINIAIFFLSFSVTQRSEHPGIGLSPHLAARLLLF